MEDTVALRIRSRLFALSALPALALAGCDWGSTEPVSISLGFTPSHSLNPDGSCVVQYVAEASGFGSATWDRVTVRRSGNVVADYTGAQTADFWGAARIEAGEQQFSVPFVAPNGGTGTEIEVLYRIAGPQRSVDLQPACPAA
jgi:hypothetical protein